MFNRFGFFCALFVTVHVAHAGEPFDPCSKLLSRGPTYSRGWHLIDGEWTYVEKEFSPTGADHVKKPELRRLKSVPHEVRTSDEDQVFFPNDDRSYPARVHRLRTEFHEVRIVVPKVAGDPNVGREIVRLLLELPVHTIKALSEVVINLNPKTKRGAKNRLEIQEEAGASALTGRLQVYPKFFEHVRRDESLALHIFRHELGHLVAEKLFGHPFPQGGYVHRAAQDASSVSAYGDTSLIEDFAEAHAAYLETEGGALNPERRRRLANRFDFIEAIYSGPRF